MSWHLILACVLYYLRYLFWIHREQFIVAADDSVYFFEVIVTDMSNAIDLPVCEAPPERAEVPGTRTQI